MSTVDMVARIRNIYRLEISIDVTIYMLQEVTASYLRCLGMHVEVAETVQYTLELLSR